MLRRFSTFAGFLFLVSCGNVLDPVESFDGKATEAYQINITAGNNQSVFQGDSLSPLEVQVLNLSGTPVSGAQVEFKATEGNLRLSTDTPIVTNESGKAAINVTFGTHEGAGKIRASLLKVDRRFVENTNIDFNLLTYVGKIKPLTSLTDAPPCTQSGFGFLTPFEFQVLSNGLDPLKSETFVVTAEDGEVSKSFPFVATNTLQTNEDGKLSFYLNTKQLSTTDPYEKFTSITIVPQNQNLPSYKFRIRKTKPYRLEELYPELQTPTPYISPLDINKTPRISSTTGIRLFAHCDLPLPDQEVKVSITAYENMCDVSEAESASGVVPTFSSTYNTFEDGAFRFILLQPSEINARPVLYQVKFQIGSSPDGTLAQYVVKKDCKKV